MWMTDVQAPQDCGIAIESAPNEIKEFAVLHERSHFIVLVQNTGVGWV